VGLSTSRARSHEASDGRPVASRMADWREVEAIVEGMGELNAGLFQIAPERHIGPHYNEPLKDLAIRTGRPITQGMTVSLRDPDEWRPQLALMDAAAREGGRMFAQVHTQEIALLLSFETNLPFDEWDVWREFRQLPLEQQKAGLRDPATRERLADVASRPYQGPTVYGAAGKPPEWEWIFLYDRVEGPHRSLAELARERGVRPVDVMIDEALARDFKVFFRQVAVNGDMNAVLGMMRHPRAVVTFSDSGAHVSQIMDSSIHTHLLRYWVRERQAFTLEEAIRKVTYDTATHWGFADRGLLREGFAADVVVFDPETVAPQMPTVRHDLPAGATRLFQQATGIAATVVNGKVLLRNGEHTGNLPGRLLRGRVPGVTD
jgi:N-acyl-D-aspartate/D-glutamate deacylase